MSGLRHKLFQPEHVKLSRDLLSLRQKLPSLRENFLALLKTDQGWTCTQKAQKNTK
jgi:hypothetical protein